MPASDKGYPAAPAQASLTPVTIGRFEWADLPKWPTSIDYSVDAQTRRLWDEWRTTFGGGPWDSEALDDLDRFVGGWLHLLPAVATGESPEAAWLRKRLRKYSEARRGFRETYRSARLRAARRSYQQRRKDLAVFTVWAHAPREQDLSDFQEILNHVYLLQLQAMDGGPSRTAALLREAAGRCEAGFASLRKLELKRRSHILYSLAAEREAFATLGLRDLETARDLFEEAATQAVLGDISKEYEYDTHPMYLQYWRSAVACRLAQRDLDIETARSEWSAAAEILAGFERRDAFFASGNLWCGVEDFEREPLVIDALAHARNGDLEETAKLFGRWLTEADGDPAVTQLRRTRIALRHAIVLALSALAAGRGHQLPLARARSLRFQEPRLGAATDALIHAVEACAAGTMTLAEAASRMTAALPVDADSRGGSARKQRTPLDWVPRWYARLYNACSPPWRAAPVLARWYLRDVVDWVFSVYVDGLVEAGYGGDTPRRPDLSLASIADFETALQALHRAMRWQAGSGDAIERLMVFCQIAHRCDSDEELMASLLDAMSATERLLYPTPARFVCDGPRENEVTVESFIGVRESQVVRPRGVPIPQSGFFYFKPVYKEREVIQRTDAKPLHVYEADSFGIPQRVLVGVEGPTDRSVMVEVLAHLDPAWDLLEISIRAAGGADELARMVADGPSEALVLLVDQDVQAKKGPSWDRLWQECQVFQLRADIERVDLAALRDALATLGTEVTLPELIALDTHSKETGTNFGRALEGRFSLGRLKGDSLGTALGRAFVHRGAPALVTKAARAALRIAQGAAEPCANPRHSHPPAHGHALGR